MSRAHLAGCVARLGVLCGGERTGIKIVALVLALLLACASSPTHAQQDSAVAAATRPPKSPGMAFSLSLFGSVVPAAVGYNLVATGADHDSEWALFLFGVYAGPSLGHFYAGQSGQALKGVAIRSGILLATGLLLSQTGVCLESCEGETVADEYLVFLAGLGFTLVSAGYDIFTASRSAHRTNRQRAGIALWPWVSPKGDIGLRTTITF